ncbi:uncharacterized protein LOC132286896 [Cornus florida]|uniref:uncharacterized protein LOC132286896 n=1 Tax=Cornus florida TaxID=4283 RepID=UPI0028A2B3B3|nr:uncharacterized protein LOC132286896 [Cornus florida]
MKQMHGYVCVLVWKRRTKCSCQHFPDREIYMDKGYQESGNVNVESNVGDNKYNKDGNVDGVNETLKDVPMGTIMQTEQCEELWSQNSNLPQGEVGEGSFERLPRVAEPEMYPGAPMATSTFLSKLFHIKDTYRWTDKCIDDLLEFCKDVCPEGETLPGSYDQAKKFMRDLGLDEHHEHKIQTGVTDGDARELNTWDLHSGWCILCLLGRVIPVQWPTPWIAFSLCQFNYCLW